MTTSTESQALRGEIWLVSFGAGRPGEPGKHQPAIVLSDDGLSTKTNNPRELVLVVPLSASATPSPLRPTIAQGQGLERDSVAVVMATRGIARSRLLERIGVVDPAPLAQIASLLARATNGRGYLE
ncbi:MAG: type II toxin-antitoxin system PemK/MazF family toxin [Propionibacteriaceae bacterium]|nr:type II toxin-antitoxin system PemK/MazF family toxin [Propionibacteriaceae bacterium]